MHVQVILDGPRAVSKLFAVVIFIEGEAGAAGGHPDERDEDEQGCEHVARCLQIVSFFADLKTCRVPTVDRHQDHQCGLEEGRDDDCEDDASNLHPQLVVKQSKDDYKAEDSVEEVGKDAKLKDRFKLLLHTVIF